MSRGRITGIRSCTSTSSVLGVVVRIVQVSLNRATSRVSPSIPKTRKRKQGIVLHSEVERLFLFPAAPPFEKSVGGKQAPATHEGVPEGGLIRDRFCSGIDRLESDTGVRGPGRNQAPASQREVPLRLGWILTNDSDRLRRGDIVAWLPIDFVLGLEVFLDQLFASGQTIATTSSPTDLCWVIRPNVANSGTPVRLLGPGIDFFRL